MDIIKHTSTSSTYLKQLQVLIGRGQSSLYDTYRYTYRIGNSYRDIVIVIAIDLYLTITTKVTKFNKINNDN